MSKYCCVATQVRAQSMRADDWRLDRLVDRLPNRIRTTVRFLRQPSARWLRIPMGATCHCCGRAGGESLIGSNNNIQIGYFMGLARNDPS